MTFDLHPTLANDSFLVARVTGVQVRLMNDSRYFWLLVVPETSATELHELDPKLADHMWRVVTALGAQLKTHTEAVKIKEDLANQDSWSKHLNEKPGLKAWSLANPSAAEKARIKWNKKNPTKLIKLPKFLSTLKFLNQFNPGFDEPKS